MLAKPYFDVAHLFDHELRNDREAGWLAARTAE
jgi:hypothetical protein